MPDWSPDGTSIVLREVQAEPAVLRRDLRRDRRLGGLALRHQERRRHVGQPDRSRRGRRGQRVLPELFAGRRASSSSIAARSARTRRARRRARTTRPTRRSGPCRRRGGSPIALARAGSTHGDSWPKWMVREQKYRGKKLMWLDVLERAAPTASASAPTTTRRSGWPAFDPDAAAQGKDASFPAFWLPFQEHLERQSHRAVGHARRASGLRGQLSVRGQRGLHRHGAAAPRSSDRSSRASRWCTEHDLAEHHRA